MLYLHLYILEKYVFKAVKKRKFGISIGHLVSNELTINNIHVQFVDRS